MTKKTFELPEIEETAASKAQSSKDEEGRTMVGGAVYDIPVTVSVVLGKTTMPVSQLLKLGRGAVVELERRVGELVDIYVNNRMVARGELVIMDDSKLGITMTEIVKSDAAH